MLAQNGGVAHRSVGLAGDGAQIDGGGFCRSIPEVASKGGNIHIGVCGDWYDVTDFVWKHPGGDIILEYADRDATLIFYAFHPRGVLEKRRDMICGTYDYKPTIHETAYMRLYRDFEERGFFASTSMWWYGCHVAFVVFSIITAVIVARYGVAFTTSCHLVATFAGLLLWNVRHMSGFLTHDHMHSQIFHDRKRDHYWGAFWASFGLGANGHIWRDLHFEHHAFTNAFVPGIGPSDPQMLPPSEGLWCQDRMLAQLFKPNSLAFMSQCQHVVFFLVVLLVGRFGFLGRYDPKRDRESKNRKYSLKFWYCHIMLNVTVCLQLPSWALAAEAYIIAYLCQVILAVQLFMSHYNQPWEDKTSLKDGSISFLERQVIVNKDIDNPWWLDWFWGGLNHHLAHHLFPRMSRMHYREATRLIDCMCAEFGLTRNRASQSAAVKELYTHLKEVLVDVPASETGKIEYSLW